MTTAKNENVKITAGDEEIECMQEFTFIGS